MGLALRGATGRRPVMADVARAAGVSQKTVSRVVNDAPHVRPDVRERVERAIAELGYRPNATARALVTQRTQVIGIVSAGSPLYGPAATLFGLERAAHEAGYSVLITSADDASRSGLEAAVARLLDVGVDGIAVGGPFVDADLAQDVFHEVPFISVGEPLPGLHDQLAVAVDQVDGARMATEHLLALGHRTVWHVSGPDSWQSSRARRTGWSQALEAAGAPRPDSVRGDWSPRSGYEAGLTLAEQPHVTAVFVANDHMATGLLRALRERGRDVPGDVSVVGFDDAPEAGYLSVPLTTVRQDFSTMAHRAVAELVAAMSGRPHASGPVTIPVELVVRESAGPAP